MIDQETVGILYEGSVAHMTFQAINLKDIIKKIVAYIEELKNQKGIYEKNIEILEEKIEKLELEIKALREQEV